VGRAIGRFAGYFGTGTPYTVFGAGGTSNRSGTGFGKCGFAHFAAGLLRGNDMIPKLIDVVFWDWVDHNAPLLFVGMALFCLAYLLNKYGKGGRHAA